MSDYEKLNKRITDLEEKMTNKKNEKSEKPQKAPRKPSPYNDFIKNFFLKNKNSNKTHRELFVDAAKAWSENKNKTKA